MMPKLIAMMRRTFWLVFVAVIVLFVKSELVVVVKLINISFIVAFVWLQVVVVSIIVLVVATHLAVVVKTDSR